MRLLIQRVTHAQISIHRHTTASINAGMVVLVGFHAKDTPSIVEGMLDKLFAYRLFADSDQKTNCSLVQTKGDLLLVPQFTLYANTNSGLRPSYSQAASPDSARSLFDCMCFGAAKRAASTGLRVELGTFGAHMELSLTNDGPMTLVLDSAGRGEP